LYSSQQVPKKTGLLPTLEINVARVIQKDIPLICEFNGEFYVNKDFSVTEGLTRNHTPKRLRLLGNMAEMVLSRH
jgi:hypothetical protein